MAPHFLYHIRKLITFLNAVAVLGQETLYVRIYYWLRRRKKLNRLVIALSTDWHWALRALKYTHDVYDAHDIHDVMAHEVYFIQMK